MICHVLIPKRRIPNLSNLFMYEYDDEEENYVIYCAFMKIVDIVF